MFDVRKPSSYSIWIECISTHIHTRKRNILHAFRHQTIVVNVIWNTMLWCVFVMLHTYRTDLWHFNRNQSFAFVFIQSFEWSLNRDAQIQKKNEQKTVILNVLKSLKWFYKSALASLTWNHLSILSIVNSICCNLCTRLLSWERQSANLLMRWLKLLILVKTGTCLACV